MIYKKKMNLSYRRILFDTFQHTHTHEAIQIRFFVLCFIFLSQFSFSLGFFNVIYFIAIVFVSSKNSGSFRCLIISKALNVLNSSR